MSAFRYVDKISRSFVLADGVIPLKVTGTVELSMQFGTELIIFYALVADKFCIDLILGMDFMLTFSANIDMKSQYFSLEIAGRRTVIRVDDQLRRPLVPLHSRHASILPPGSTVKISVSSPISSVSAYFIPTSVFLEQSNFRCSQKTVTIQHHHSSLLVTNISNSPQHIPQYFCFGYLLSNQAEQQTYFDRLSALYRHYNEKKNRQILSSASTQPHLSHRPSRSLTNVFLSVPLKSTAILSSNPPNSFPDLHQTLDLLTKHLLDINQRNHLSSLLTQFSQLFDNFHHNISNTVIENIFNTVPHSPPAFRSH